MASYERIKEPWLIDKKLGSPLEIQLLFNIIDERKNVLVVGDRQSGKTSFLRWVVNHVERLEKVLLFDFYSEINTSNAESSIIRVGYKNDADIKGDFNKVHFNDLIHKALLLPFDRIISDDLFGNELDLVLDSLHGMRSGFFGVNQSSIENAIKFLFLKTIYPESKELTFELEQKAVSVFPYAIFLNDTIQIYKLEYDKGLKIIKMNVE